VQIKGENYQVIYDLHCHSTASDGSLSPTELLAFAAERKVDFLALTDHDTTDGIAEALLKADTLHTNLITGIELSTQWKGQSIHIVGLNFNIDSEALQATVARQKQRRIDRAKEISTNLEKVGIENAYDGAQRYAQGVVVRPHFARYLVELGVVSSINSAFKKYLGPGKPGDVPNIWVDLPGVIETIAAAGGVPVLAHPGKYKMTRTKLKRLVGHFKELGGQAIEVVSGSQRENDTRCFADIAIDYDLHCSCGSDFHAPGQPWQNLGILPQLPSQCRPVWDKFS